MQELEKGTLSIDSENIMPIIKKWLYSDTDIFIRELVSNANDAITKLKKLKDIGEADFSDDEEFKIKVVIDKEGKTITISDNGLGMSADEIKEYINQIAFSGAKGFVEKYQDKLGEDAIIGHFGLGFYSAFMVSDKVEIHSKNFKGELAAHWISDGKAEYSLGESDKQARGTDVVLHVNEESADFLLDYKIREILEKYCSFMPVEIYLNADEDPINKTPLWTRKPSEITDEEYKSFYKSTFKDFNDPLFWIHLNMDHPFTLKGILYFPRLKHHMEQVEGQVKLFCNQVYVADNVKEVIPEYLLLLKGVLDCPDIPLNVSRSFLQTDGNVTKMSSYVSRKVADKLNSIYKKERENYEENWSHISPFIKYGSIKERDFYDKMAKSIIYETTKGDYATLSDFIERNSGAGSEEPLKEIYYSNNKALQAQYINLIKEQGLEAVILETGLDAPFISYVENYENIRFIRIDSALAEALKGEEVSEEEASTIKELFSKLNENIKVESLKTENVPAILTQTEESRRMEEMQAMFGGMGMPMPEAKHELIINTKNPLIARLVKEEDESKKELISNHIYDIAKFNQKQLTPEEKNEFITRTNEILLKLL
ncbi:MAG: molecular chaperone HtpG [Defluviitaleaceae bacterium]|nr:molecular chaperone HtpG [Defluviitaleaceae bacterium]